MILARYRLNTTKYGEKGPKKKHQKVSKFNKKKRRPGTAVGGEWAMPGGGHSILGLPQDFHILNPEKTP